MHTSSPWRISCTWTILRLCTDCLLKFCRLINVGAGCGALLCMVALGMAMSVSEAEAVSRSSFVFAIEKMTILQLMRRISLHMWSYTPMIIWVLLSEPWLERRMILVWIHALLQLFIMTFPSRLSLDDAVSLTARLMWNVHNPGLHPVWYAHRGQSISTLQISCLFACRQRKL